ncbi:phosphomannomutase [Luteibacter anthropi]|uniref:phosphomannomutase n=1 Tax=Luteibacter anthropi TaxID=564369 RepID=UPI0025493F75|nr:phosphomannomutase [Luteibacter anthropi]
MAMKCFKAYDIRGRLGEELNADIAYRIGRAFADAVGKGSVVVGYDVRLSSTELAEALGNGLMDAGCDVIDIGLCGTEEVYFHSFHRDVIGGIMVTASHNPLDWNGMKLVREGARPISGDTGLRQIEAAVEANSFQNVASVRGSTFAEHSKKAYIDHLMGYIDTKGLRPLRIVVNPGNGCAGPVIELLRDHLPFELIPVHFEPDGTFPHGIPNPLLPENRAATAEAVRRNKADFGLAWDGDFDRCFFFDEEGHFIEGYYLVGLLATQLLAGNPGEKVIHDPRLTWNTIDVVQKAGGIPVQSKTGHAFIKERMRVENAIYGGEMSAHHYFRDFAYCDSGMIPWLLIAELVSRSGATLGELVRAQVAAFPCSGEINFKVDDTLSAINRVQKVFAGFGPVLDFTDGVSADFGSWRYNIRSSNTEPLLRLNVESKGDIELVMQKVEQITGLLES